MPIMVLSGLSALAIVLMLFISLFLGGDNAGGGVAESDAPAVSSSEETGTEIVRRGVSFHGEDAFTIDGVIFEKSEVRLL